MNPIDAHLDSVTVNTLVWKPGVHRDIAGSIVRVALAGRGMVPFWPDEIELHVAAADRNCIGLSWRFLANQGVIAKTGLFRRSQDEDANGRIVFQYRLLSVALARRFLSVNGLEQPALHECQGELVGV